MKHRLPSLVCLAMLVILWLSGVASSDTSGGLTGIVRDQSKAVIMDAEVEIKNINKGSVQSTKN
jgi:hypothetical protein